MRMDSENKEFQGFDTSDIDPLVFVESEEQPELRDAVLNIPRPLREEETVGPIKTRAEIVAEELSRGSVATEWVPSDEEETKSNNLNKSEIVNNLYQGVFKGILFILPLAVIFIAISYASSQL